MTVISGAELKRRIFDEEVESSRLVITPLLVVDVQIQQGSSSVDVRLGTRFITQRRSNVPYLDPGQEGTTGSRQLREENIVIPFGKKFVLHPNQFALGSTLEYISMPLDLAAYVVGRSSWGRLGLIVATAIGVHPGYRGIITLELRNIGEVPFLLRPGMRIAQIFFHKVEGKVNEKGVLSQYIGSMTPESYYLKPDKDLGLIDYIGSVLPSSETDVNSN